MYPSMHLGTVGCKVLVFWVWGFGFRGLRVLRFGVLWGVWTLALGLVFRA